MIMMNRKKSSFTRRTYGWPYFSLEIKDLIFLTTNIKVNVGQLPRYFLYYGMVTYTMLKNF